MCACVCARTRESQRKTEKMHANDKQHNNYSHENEMNKTEIKSSNREKEKGKNATIAMVKASHSFTHGRRWKAYTNKIMIIKKLKYVLHTQTLTKAPEISANSVHTNHIA